MNNPDLFTAITRITNKERVLLMLATMLLLIQFTELLRIASFCDEMLVRMMPPTVFLFFILAPFIFAVIYFIAKLQLLHKTAGDFSPSSGISPWGVAMLAAIAMWFTFSSAFKPVTDREIQPWYGITVGKALPANIPLPFDTNFMFDNININGHSYRTEWSHSNAATLTLNGRVLTMPATIDITLNSQTNVVTDMIAAFELEDRQQAYNLEKALTRELHTQYSTEAKWPWRSSVWADTENTGLEVRQKDNHVYLTLAAGQAPRKFTPPPSPALPESIAADIIKDGFGEKR